MIRKIIGIAICLTAITVGSRAQELGIELTGGLQGTKYLLQNGQTIQLPGGSLGFSYSFRLGRHWNLLSGVTGGIYRTQATLKDGVVYTYDQVDDAGSAFQYNVKTTGYKETQQFIAASIPLLLQYHTVGPYTQWYFSAGGKVLFPLNAGVRQSAQQLSLSGYYPDYNLEVSNLPQHGFGTINHWTASQTVPLTTTAALSAATGLSFRLSRGTRLYTGVYLDYGLSDLKGRSDSMPLVTYNSGNVNSVQANSVLKMPIAGQMTLLSFGLQMRISFGSSNAKPVDRRSSKQAPPAISADDTAFLQTPILFGALGETEILDFQKLHLDDVVTLMKQYPNIRISIVGHICNSGDGTEKMEIGEARAKAVAGYLQNSGIRSRRMDVSYMHESDPVLPNNPSANYRNRRVVITVE
jgi:outer membrane protein OmpA-like peptidoglycan-associated protein